MSSQFVRDQPAGYKNYLSNVAIVGATGQMGSHIVRELLKTSKHTVTAITREESVGTPAAGVKVARVNYDDTNTIVEALKGQDVLVITMNTMAPQDTCAKLIEGAAKAGVRWILPDAWGVCNGVDRQFHEDIFIGPPKDADRDLIEKMGVSSWTAVSGGFWYEYSLGTVKDMYGFDLQKKEVTFFDKGEARMNTSTWENEARAVRSLLSMKILPEDEHDLSPTLDRNFKNKFVFVSSFCVGQKDMFESLKRVTGTTDADWKIDYEGSKERYANAVKTMQEGNRVGFVRALYTRCFFPDEPVLFEKYGELSNEVLGLPKEDLDQCTRGAIERSNALQK